MTIVSPHIGAVVPTGIDAARRAYAQAGTSIIETAASLRGADTLGGRLPWIIGRRSSFRDVDSSLATAHAHAREALALLDGVQLEPGAGADALAHVRASVTAIDELIDARRALPKASARWHDRSIDHATYSRLERLGTGIHDIGNSQTVAWASRPWRGSTYPAYTQLPPGDGELRRTLIELDPEAADRVRPWIATQGEHYTPHGWQPIADSLNEPGLSEAGVAQQGLWNVSRAAYRTAKGSNPVTFGATDLRRMVDEFERHIDWPVVRPTWLVEAADDAYLPITAERAADLEVMGRARDPRMVELFVAHGLVNEHRRRLVHGVDVGALEVGAARRLPGGLGDGVPAGIELDDAAARAWARELRTAPARARFAEHASIDGRFINELIQGGPDTPAGTIIGNAIVARELLDSLEPGSIGRTEVVTHLRERLDDFIERNEFGWHIEYASLGRVQASSGMLATIDANASGAATPAAASSLRW